MSETRLGSNNGIDTLKFIEGHIYVCPSEISEYLTTAWLKSGVCRKVGHEPEEKKVIVPDAVKGSGYKLPQSRANTPMPEVKPPKPTPTKMRLLKEII